MEVVRRVLLADTGEELRRSLASGLSSETDMQVVGQTGDGVELLRMIRELKPDIVVMELVLTGMDGLEVLDETASLEQRPKILILSSYIRGNVVEIAAGVGLVWVLRDGAGVPVAAVVPVLVA